MSDTAIRVENLGKSYLVGHNNAQPEGYKALRDVIANGARNIVRTTRDLIHGRPIVQGDEVEEFWALKDVSFEIKRGERVGIIGRNGAGKSTLLKVLSRITEPTRGRVTIQGRVASLLEVGTGFHPELTGRENIFLNGAILGMARKEVQQRFSQIVEFAEVERFLDTPVKRYSSGMYVKLAFAVAAHLDSEILILDEVLAVGDASFQRKCLRRMREVTESGRTLMLVSHSMGAIRDICSRAILLESGFSTAQGVATDIVDKYMRGATTKTGKGAFVSSCGGFSLSLPIWVDEGGAIVSAYTYGGRVRLKMEFEFTRPMGFINPGLAVKDSAGNTIFISHLVDDPDFTSCGDYRDKVTLITEFDLPALAPGIYTVAFGVRNARDETLLYSEGDLHLEITASGKNKNGAGGVLWHTTSWQRFDSLGG